MKHTKPGRIEDNAPSGHQANPGHQETPATTTKKRSYKIIIEVGFDENLKEFKLWDYLYDVKTDHFELDAIPDYEKRLQYYEIGADRKALRNLRAWLKENSFIFKVVRR